MDLTWKEILGALVTLTVALLGYLQWKRTKRSGSFLPDKEAAYKALWAALEEAHICTRADVYDHSEFVMKAKIANTLMIRNGLHLSGADKKIAAEYLATLEGLGGVLESMGPDHPTRRAFSMTTAVVPLPDSYAPAFRRMDQARQQAIVSFRKAIGAGEI